MRLISQELDDEEISAYLTQTPEEEKAREAMWLLMNKEYLEAMRGLCSCCMLFNRQRRQR
jgi:hypothetical protein